MKKLLTWAIVGALGLYGYRHYSQHRAVTAPPAVDSLKVERTDDSRTRFKCDGREYCSQMTSCEEAMYFLQNCPGVKMDGEGDGIPCERQWCGQR